MRNCKLELEWETKAELLSSFMEQMRMSGYDARDREETLRSILTGWDRMVVEDKETYKSSIFMETEVEEKTELVPERWRV